MESCGTSDSSGLAVLPPRVIDPSDVSQLGEIERSPIARTLSNQYLISREITASGAALGGSAAEGHNLVFRDPAAWEHDVFAFLDERVDR